MPSPILIGRQKELGQLRANLEKRQPTLLTGAIGTGKSHLLKYFAKDLTNAIYVEHIRPIKQALLSIAETLHKDGRLKIDGVVAEYLEWQDLKATVSQLYHAELLNCVVEGIQGQGYILIFDHLDEVTSLMAPTLSILMDKASVVGATRDLKDPEHLNRLWWNFDIIELKNLSKEGSLELLWTHADKDRVKDKVMFENKILNHSAGNPLAIIEMAKKTLNIEFDSLDKIRLLRHDAGLKYLDLTPALLVVGACIVAARFIALGLNDVDTYILAGGAGAFFIILRYSIYRSMRKTK
jgi:Archaeal ATPase.